MTANPFHKISSAKALDLLVNGEAIFNSYVEGKIKLLKLESFCQTIEFRNCILSSFSGAVTTFSFFEGNLVFENCNFDDYLDIQAGINSCLVRFVGNIFNEFVNFFDRLFIGEVVALKRH